MAVWGTLLNCCICLIATSGDEEGNSETAERRRLNCGGLRRPWGEEPAQIQTQFSAGRYCPVMLGLTQGTHTGTHTRTVCTVMAIETYTQVLAYIQIQGHAEVHTQIGP